ncbi:MAG: V-type ATP synthase subunit E [ANME-2 cluster archaeon]|jgi:V/A-type H+-transporting ATPase subunit E|nr:MAG: V-type ATP synthase subunit E [ANME-2 cluster archaeon]
MGLENVVSDILKSAKADVSAIEADRDSEVSSIVEEAKRTGERITGEKVASAEEEVTRIRKQEISGANLEVRRMMLNTRKGVLDETQRQTAERLHEMDTESLLRSLIRAHSSGVARVYSSRQDQPIVERLCDELLEDTLTKLEYAGNIDCIGGIVLETEDETVRLDYTFDTILSEVGERSMKQISNILFG